MTTKRVKISKQQIIDCTRPLVASSTSRFLNEKLPDFIEAEAELLPDPVPEFSGFERISDAPKSALTFDPVAEGEWRCCLECAVDESRNCPRTGCPCSCHKPKEDKCSACMFEKLFGGPVPNLFHDLSCTRALPPTEAPIQEIEPIIA